MSEFCSPVKTEETEILLQEHVSFQLLYKNIIVVN